MGESLGVLFTTLASAAEQQVSKFNVRDLANTAWGFATVGQSDEKLFAALAGAAQRLASEFKAQGLANTA